MTPSFISPMLASIQAKASRVNTANFPKGVVYPGYRNKLWQSETMDGIRVIRVWSFITANGSGAIRAIAGGMFECRQSLWSLQFGRADAVGVLW